MSTRTTPTTVALALALAALTSVAAFAQEGGGTSGADFLISLPSPRVSAMGGVADPLGCGLEAMSYNPAALAGLDTMRLQLTIDPLPNTVTNSHLAFGLPILGGYGAAAVQLLNAGGFTVVNELGQPLDTVNVFDSALAVAYARPIWRTVSLGADLKGIWRSLGTENAFAFAGDLGAAAWFETPHIGQPPKPPTRAALEERARREQALIDAEKSRRVAAASKASTEASRALEAAQKTAADLAAQLEKAAEDKKPPIAAKQQEAQAKVETQQATLADEQKAEADSLAAIDAWYAEEVAGAQAAAAKRLADLDSIAEERRVLFAVIDDPARELTPEMLDANIDSSIEKTRGLQQQRTDAANQRKAAYDQRRAAQAEAITRAIEGYQKLIDEAGAPTTANQVDPYVKRLQDRIAAKQKEQKQLEADAASMAQATQVTIAGYGKMAEGDIKDFEALRVSLQKELKKDKLRRELDMVEARSKSAQDKIQSDYKAKERQLYLRLLSAMYRHEEAIFQDRLAALKDDAAVQEVDFQADQETARETLDNGWAFDDRTLSAKISEMSRGLQKGVPEPEELVATRKERSDREAAYQVALKDLEQSEKEFTASEKARVDDATTAIADERSHVRLVYLQTDKPYLNTAVGLGVRNVGTPVKFATEAVALPMSAEASLSYALINLQDHNLKLTTQVDVPFLDTWSWSVGIGVEYVYAGIAYARVGYNVNQTATGFSALSAGLGVHLAAGFTTYAVDYAFKPLADYGFQHSIGVTIGF
jgi:hypothetical protein